MPNLTRLVPAGWRSTRTPARPQVVEFSGRRRRPFEFSRWVVVLLVALATALGHVGPSARQ